MLIHKLAKLIKTIDDDNVVFVERDHPFSGVADSQLLLTFKKEKLKISVTQMSDAGKLYVCIIGRKLPHSAGESYEWKEVWFKPTLEDKYIPQMWVFIKAMASQADKFRGKTMPISYKEAIECLSKEIKNNKKH